jgi:hypothetical protein
MEPNSAEAQITRALYELTVGTDSIQERLGAAWLVLMALTKEDIPPSLREAFGTIETEMLSAPEDPETLSEQAASESAERILRFAVQLWQAGK